ncbi:methyltransferase domain-containing protein [Candidatus Poribacteria bacterium]|nr:methyltransferase domain-containing protein [Candidatus Poribacteria bacterium]MYG06577.1 methyltransferase domain-containing protein [Candidatus Poribacteria bacterium]MYK20783.1 methyltransferase domain-containing protein [Candidatus Poribacteria bacterium]
MNIRPNDFVLEIGSGHNPKARSDVLCDKFIGDDEQRGGAIITDRPIVEADGELLPFADRAFDYVICSHVLEHVKDPKRFIAELTRVARRGYIETPSEIGERIYGWHYHNWVVNLVDGCLMLRKNEKNSQFGKLFHRLAVTDKHWKRFHMTHHHLFLVQHEWEDKIDYKILLDHESALDLECHDTLDRLVASEGNVPKHNEWLLLLKSAVPRGIVSRAKSLLTKTKGKSRQTKTLQEILVCPQCKGAITWEDHSLYCKTCEQTYRIIDGIPRFTF